MKVIPPVSITSITSSTVAEPAAGETAWVSGTTYAVNDVVIRTSTHRKYQRAVAGAGTTAPESDTANWVDIGPTNRWAMFDTLRNSATTGTSPLTVVVPLTTRITSIALVGLIGSSVTITMESGGSTVYTHTESLTGRNTVTWSDYFYNTFGQQRTVVRFDLPRYATSTITVTLTGTGTLEIGAMVVGTAIDLGKVISGASSLANNYSTVSRDTYGNATLVPRRSIPSTTQRLLTPKANVDAVRDIRTLLNAVPAIWSGLDDAATDGYFESLLILGIYKEFSINLNASGYADVNLTLEEI